MVVVIFMNILLFTYKLINIIREDKMKYKIGQKIEFTDNFTIEVQNGKKARIVKGDAAMIVRKVDETSGEILYITGEASGLSQIISIEVDDNVDADYLAKRIMEDL
jgi:hypothetical protein